MKVILFGASGHLGLHIAKEVLRRNYELTVVVRNPSKLADEVTSAATVVKTSFADDAAFSAIVNGNDVVISALGKSVSPSDRSKSGFEEVDLKINRLILKHSLSNDIKKFVYISAYHAERYPELEYFRVHEQFATELKASGLDYSIIKPPSLFSAYLEMIPMARRGMLFNFGKAECRTNPIYDGDLAEIAVTSIHQSFATIEAGGKKVYTRGQLTDIIQRSVAPQKKVRSIPLGILKVALPLVRPFDRNTYDKLAFFAAVMQVDTIAPPAGATSFEEFIERQTKHVPQAS